MLIQNISSIKIYQKIQESLDNFCSTLFLKKSFLTWSNFEKMAGLPKLANISQCDVKLRSTYEILLQ